MTVDFTRKIPLSLKISFAGESWSNLAAGHRVYENIHSKTEKLNTAINKTINTEMIPSQITTLKPLTDNSTFRLLKGQPRGCMFLPLVPRTWSRKMKIFQNSVRTLCTKSKSKFSQKRDFLLI